MCCKNISSTINHISAQSAAAYMSLPVRRRCLAFSKYLPIFSRCASGSVGLSTWEKGTVVSLFRGFPMFTARLSW